ncbi:MAG TPA: XdhC family protein [Chloroflexota bacterium]|nr:XdhC family protein [Chloroflexota bacterium]
MSGPGEFYQSLHRSLENESHVAVATIVRTRGSSPREVGARMLVRHDGGTDGTVGGGCGEAEVWRTALEVLADEQPRMVEVNLTNEIAINTDGVCGGIMDIFVEPWKKALNGNDVAGGVLEAVAQRRVATTATVVSRSRGMPVELGEKLLVVDGQIKSGHLSWDLLQERVLADVAGVVGDARSTQRTYELSPTDDPALSRAGKVAVFFDLALPKPTLVVIGAGHVAVPIAQVGRLMDFEVIVVDDRPSFANAERFPDADQIVVDDFSAAIDGLEITPSTYIVLVTRGHTHDVHALRKIVRQPAGYVGMIGSRRRVYAVFKLLRDEGVPVEDLLKVHAPIGLDIKTETPGEIAVSVGAELLKVRRGGDAASMSDILRPQYRYSLTKGDDDI